ncbi:MAG: nitrite reductase [Psychromonas sp.]|nr:nitrite reductase [Psychromonas sp.]
MKRMKWPTVIGTLLITGSLATYAVIGNYPQLMKQKTEQAQLLLKQPVLTDVTDIPKSRIELLQEKLYQDKQNAQLWYQLGHAYLLSAEYKNAVTVFDYSIRLTDSITSDHYASKAAAVYYSNKQQMGDEVKELISLALAIDENNQTALMMLANEQFMQARYPQAITLWVRILDSNQADLDRVAIIHRINQAKQFL